MRTDIDIDNAIYTLKKIQFFDDLKRLGISHLILLEKIRRVYNLTTDESKRHLYKKAVSYSRPFRLTRGYIFHYVIDTK